MYKAEFIVEHVETFAGSSKGFVNGKGMKSQFSNPFGICFNPNDNCFYICDCNNHAIRKLSLNGIFIQSHV
jgi:hypothetical protein